MIATLAVGLRARRILGWRTPKDEVINPLIADQYKLLALIAEQIASSEIDLSSVKSKMDAFDARKRELAEAFLRHRSTF
ncbi:hypothetical protein ACVIRO_005843 [Rhizobium ruizarguesonis]